MKQKLFTTAMLVCFAAVSKAQTTPGRVGINTSTPAATLDIVADLNTVSKPDALLVPRMLASDLETKDTAGAYGAAQNGAIVYITGGTGTITNSRTVLITGIGFYYYDAPNSIWKPVGGGSGSSTPQVPQPYENIRGTVTTVIANNYTIAANDYVVVTAAPSGSVSLVFPDLTNNISDIGRTVYVYNNNTEAQGNSFSANVLGTPVNNQYRGLVFIWSGTKWLTMSK